MIKIEIMTPEEYQNRGANLKIHYSTFKTEFGLYLVASTDRGICNVLFSETGAAVVKELKSRWPKAKIIKKAEQSHRQIEKYFSGISKSAESPSEPWPKTSPKIKLHLRGTDFQIKVWRALLSIKGGEVSSYGDIAEKLGDRKLSRAVGAALGSNPISHIIPCHRVLKSNGEISGYRWGIDRKKAMLHFEATRKML